MRGETPLQTAPSLTSGLCTRAVLNSLEDDDGDVVRMLLRASEDPLLQNFHHGLVCNVEDGTSIRCSLSPCAIALIPCICAALKQHYFASQIVKHLLHCTCVLMMSEFLPFSPF